MRLLLALCAGLLFSIAAPNIVYAASFDCNKATTLVELAICSDAELSTLDDELAARYKEAMRTTDNEASLRKDQRSWLTIRNNCKDIKCLKEAYMNRIGDLGGYTTQAETTQAEEEQLPGSEATSVDQRFFGRYIGTAINTTYRAQGKMSIDIEQSDRGGYQLKMKAWDGLGGEAIYEDEDVKISPDGKLQADGKFSDMSFGAIGVFRTPRFWNSSIEGMISGNKFKGKYTLFPITVDSVTACKQIPGMPCMYTEKEEGSFNLEKFEPLVRPQK